MGRSPGRAAGYICLLLKRIQVFRFHYSLVLGLTLPLAAKAALFLHCSHVKDALKKRLLFNVHSSNTGTDCTACYVQCLFISNVNLLSFSLVPRLGLPADKTFCEMVKSNKLCEKKLFVQFCCQTCLMAG